jgi:hypothetical protein
MIDAIAPDAVGGFVHVEALLARHACWPTPPEAWAKLFAAGVLLYERELPSEASRSPQGRGSPHLGPAARLLVRVLDRVSREADAGPFRAFFPLVRARGKLLPEAFSLAVSVARQDRDFAGGRPEGVRLLETVQRDIGAHEVRGLLGNRGEAEIDRDRPDLADDFRNPAEMKREIEDLARHLADALPRIGRQQGGRAEFGLVFAAIVNLREAAHHAATGRGPRPSILRSRIILEALASLIEAVDVQDMEAMLAGEDPEAARARLVDLLRDLRQVQSEFEVAIEDLRAIAREEMRTEVAAPLFQDPEAAFEVFTEIIRPRS